MSFPSYTPARWTESGLKILEERYLWKKDGRFLEDPDGLCARVGAAVARGEAPADRAAYAAQFTALLKSGTFLPNSPCLMNAGKGNGLQLSACFVLPIEDSIEGIFDTVKHAAVIHKSGGGTGFSFSRLRPAGATVGTSQGVASGPISFLRIFDTATEQIKQGGTRRGANMAVLRVDHPSIEEFIACKMPRGVFTRPDGTTEVAYDITNFNISVAVTDAFLAALEGGGEYAIVDPRDGSVVGHKRARAVWDLIIDCAWRTGDPGLLFIDRANASMANPIPAVEQLEATNPCGEQWLGPYDVCNLGSINLGLFVVEECHHSDADEAGDNGMYLSFDWDAYRETIHLATRFLDDVIEINPFPLPQITARAQALRRVGLGVMGFHDILMLLGIAYDSDEGRAFGNELMRVLESEALVASQALARERGPFPMQSVSRYRDDPPRRNSNLTTIAPTGSISILANCSSGIEPVFALTMFHSVKQPDKSWRVLKVANAAFAHVAKREGFWSADLEQHVVETGSVQGRDDVPARWQHIFRNAQEIHPHDHIRMQGAFQGHNSNSISKTINMPHAASRAEIAEAYLMAYGEGCLGTTIYRDGCKQVQVLTTGAGAKDYAVGQGVAVPLLAATTAPADDDHLCPECGEEMVDEGGCAVCPACSYSHCNWVPNAA